MIKLINNTINKQDIDELCKWLQTYPKLTKGEQTEAFEDEFARWVGTNYAVFVNSGSSANLLMLYYLKESGRTKVVVPSLSWATDLAPVIQLGMHPILCDCNLQDLSVDLEHLKQIFEQERPEVLLLVSVLGLSPNIGKIIELCNDYGVTLIEDNCESQGTKWEGGKLGNFGLMSSFSTYFGHTMSTIEGGFITTNSILAYNKLKMYRSHGWNRDVDKPEQQYLRKRHNISDFNALYTFYEAGFNVRNTEIGSFLGRLQLKKVDKMIEQRNINFKIFQKLLENKVWFPKEQIHSFTSSFSIPLILKNKQKTTQKLQENNIECRPLIAGNLGLHPFYYKRYGKCSLPNADLIHKDGIYVPNHPELMGEDIEKICSIVLENNL